MPDPGLHTGADQFDWLQPCCQCLDTLACCSLDHMLFNHLILDHATQSLLLVQVGDMRAAWKKIKAAGLDSDAALRCIYMQLACKDL